MIKYFWYSLKKKTLPRQAVIFFNTSTLSGKKRCKILLKSGIIADQSVSITSPVYFEFGNIKLIGDVFINANCNFLDNALITIDHNTMIGPNVTISTVSHPVSPEKRHSDNIILPVNIGKNVWIGAGAVILPGITIGDNSIIAANSVVNHDIPADSLYAGTPARFIKTV
ncbi:DapH/DapD/GlmU-related protein [Morganella morganii]|uniref:DapH/DapD/GlmU-related protein n=1 Tax=Morganella morganii TaxID=582 RepID=UPI001C43AC13|nr:DapH/DapD/GlmU-related protein [Morganella morganii]QXO74375.1 acetyltransferase [Morganella morganii]